MDYGTFGANCFNNFTFSAASDAGIGIYSAAGRCGQYFPHKIYPVIWKFAGIYVTIKKKAKAEVALSQ